jgi:hypothetical protein
MVFLGVYAGFGLTTSVVGIGILFVLDGPYHGIFRSVGKTLALPSGRVPEGIPVGVSTAAQATSAKSQRYGQGGSK